MFSPLIFLFIAILGIELAPKFKPYLSFQGALIVSAISYGVLLFFLWIQKKRFRNIYICQVALVSFVLVLYYAIGIQAYFPRIFAAIATLTLYLVALGIGSSFSILRLILPFAFVYLGYLILDNFLFSKFGKEWIWIAIALFLLLNMIFLPAMIQKVWNCLELPDSPLKQSLERLCREHKFRFRKMLIWQMISKQATACVIGVLPKARYILFTEPLLHYFSEEEIKATLAHEMGHCKHKHLIILPILLLGAAPLSLFLQPYLEKLPSLLSFILYAAFFFCYIRFFVGYFLRSFEKQADLYVFNCKIAPDSLIQAFEKISSINSLPLNKANWHHDSLASRIALLKEAEKTPQKIKKFHLKMRLFLISYILIIGVLIFMRLHS